MEESTSIEYYRQGDILFERIREEAAPDWLSPVEGELRIAEGEATGHAHVLVGEGIEVFDILGTPFSVRLSGPATLRHDEHAPVVLEPGCYRIRRQRRYDWGIDEEEERMPDAHD